MFKNYLILTLRNLWRNKAFSAINIFGLSIGIASCLLIVLYVLHEVSYDRHFSQAEQIYRVAFLGQVNENPLADALAGAPVAAQLKASFPEIQEATRLYTFGGKPYVSYKDKRFKEEAFAYADPSFFKLFDFSFLKGNPATALIEPKSVVISASLAQKYFGTEDPLGKLFQFKTWNTAYKVTGVIADMPANTHFHFDMLATMVDLDDAKDKGWLNFNFYTYLLLRDGSRIRDLEAKLPTEVDRFIGPEIQRALDIDLGTFRKAGNDFRAILQPLTSIHLQSHFDTELGANGNIQYVYIFLAIAGFMLLIACINFINLSTAASARRAKEVGVRKVLGSAKKQLIVQFLSESVLLAFGSLVIAVGLVILVLSAFNNLIQRTISLQIFTDYTFILGLILFGLLVGILAGSYPAFFLSSFEPVTVMKGNYSAGIVKGKPSGWFSGFQIRSGLVVFQFFVAIVLLASTVVVYRQLNYMQNKPMGYSKEQVLVIQDSDILDDNEKIFKEKARQNPQVVSVSVSGNVPVGSSGISNNGFFPQENRTGIVSLRKYQVDHDYLTTLNISLTQGRNFSRDFATDSAGILLNETAVRAFGWEKAPLGKKLIGGDEKVYTVIGVIKDFHYESLHQKIGPLAMTLGDNSGSILVKIRTDNIPAVLDSFKQTWHELTDKAPFTYSFLDERFAKVYQAEQRISKIVAIFAGLTIFIACLGLFGLTTYTAQQRTKEIGIRKVLGASVSNIVLLLSKDFVKLVLLANVLALPLAWWGIHRWLQGFAYQVEIGWNIFTLVGILAIGFALLTVSFQAIKAAMSNPVKSLRTE